MILIIILNIVFLVGALLLHTNISWSESSGSRRSYVDSVLTVWFWFTIIGLVINGSLLALAFTILVKNDYTLIGNLKYTIPTCIALVSFFSFYMWRICRKQKVATRNRIRAFFREMMPNVKPRSDHEMEFDLEMSGAHMVTVDQSKLESFSEIINRSFDVSIHQFESDILGVRGSYKIDMTRLANYIADLDFKPNNLDDLPELLVISKIKDSKYSNLRKFL